MTDGPTGADLSRPWFSHYEAGVPHHVEVPAVRLPDLVEETVRRSPDRTAFVHYGARWTYRRFWREAGAFGATLRAEGLAPGDRVALYLPNCPMHPIAYFGAMRAGLTVVQISPLYIGQDLTRVLADARPKALVTLEILEPNVARVRPEAPVPIEYVARMREFYPWTKRPFVNFVLRRRKLPTRFPSGPTIRRWSRAIAGTATPPRVSTDPSTEVAILQYTGGTTGRPKAAMLSHRNLVANALQCKAWFSNEASRDHEVVLAAVPFFHVYGMTVALNYPLLVGAMIVLQTRPDTPQSLELIDRYRPTQFPGVPAMYQAINQYPDVGRLDIRSIRVCVSGSAPLPRPVKRRFEELTGGHLIEGYGLTEASPVTHANPVAGAGREGSIGLPFPDTDQKVVDLETGRPITDPTVAGELCVRGPQVMLGYLGQPEETATVLDDGWLRTGDIATIDADGFVFIIDRKKDLIIVGGLKVYPREVEEVLFQHPAVADAAVVGRADPSLGEIVDAFVVLRSGAAATEAELIAFVRERIAHYKAPRRVEFRTELPRSAVQKVLRRELRSPAPTTGAATATSR